MSAEVLLMIYSDVSSRMTTKATVDQLNDDEVPLRVASYVNHQVFSGLIHIGPGVKYSASSPEDKAPEVAFASVDLVGSASQTIYASLPS